MSSKSNEVLKVCLDRSSRKRKFHRLIVQLRFDFYYGCHSHIHIYTRFFYSRWRRADKKLPGGWKPPTITRRETRLDEARLQPRAALIEPIKISAFSNREREKEIARFPRGSALSLGDGERCGSARGDELSSRTVGATRTYRNRVIDGTVRLNDRAAINSCKHVPPSVLHKLILFFTCVAYMHRSCAIADEFFNWLKTRLRKKLVYLRV